jgi:sugar/nucleoside kinase (ribokinase family)
MSLEVVTVGEAMRLLVAEPGVALRRATTFHASIAGSESNVALGLSRLGHRVRWLGRVGADAAGESVLAALRADAVDTSAVEIDPSRPTGLLMRDSHPTRPIDVQYYRHGSAASALSPEYLRRVGLGGARLVHVSGITAMLSDSARAATEELFALARAEGAAVSFDPNVRRKLGDPERWRSVVGPLLRQADLVFAGAGELELLGGATPGELPARVVVVKHPDHSAEVVTADGRWRRETLATTVIDPVGAGDALVTGYLSAWLRGARPEDALHDGMAAAGLVVGAVSDVEGLPNRAELDRAGAGGEAVDR